MCDVRGAKVVRMRGEEQAFATAEASADALRRAGAQSRLVTDDC
jgi:hypothetical protein